MYYLTPSKPKCHFDIKSNDLNFFTVFKELQKESEFQRKEWFRKQGVKSLFIIDLMICGLFVVSVI